MEKPYLLIFEVYGAIVHGDYATLKEASLAKQEAIDDESDPICIYNLDADKHEWIEKDGPAYWYPAMNAVIDMYRK